MTTSAACACSCAVLLVAHAGDAAALHGQPGHAAAQADVRALLPRALGHRLPQLAGAVLGIAEFLDQRGLHLALVALAGAQLAQHVRENGADGQALDALRAPGRGDLARMAAPELFRVAFKEHGVELLAEAVDVEVLQRILGQFARRRRQITHARLQRGGKAHVADGVRVHAHGIIKELFMVIDARNAPAREHHLVGALRVGPARFQGHIAAEDAVVHRGRALQGHELFPPGHHAVVLGKEAVAADVHAVAVVAHGAGNAAKGLRFLKDRHRAVPTAVEQFIGRRQSGRARANDDDLLHIASPEINIQYTYHSVFDTVCQSFIRGFAPGYGIFCHNSIDRPARLC